MAQTSLEQVAYILALIGGILLVIFGLLNLLSIGFGGPSFLYWSVYSFGVQWNCNVNLRRHSDHWRKKRHYSCLGDSADNCGTHRRWTRRLAGFTRRNNWVDCSFNP